MYIAFSADRLEIVIARDISDKELAAARDSRYASLPLAGPRYVGIKVPEKERSAALFEEMSGNPSHARPRFYVPYESSLAQIRARAKPIAELEQRLPKSKPLLDAAVARAQHSGMHGYGGCRCSHRKGFWTALIDTDNGKPVAYVDFDPY